MNGLPMLQRLPSSVKLPAAYDDLSLGSCTPTANSITLSFQTQPSIVLLTALSQGLDDICSPCRRSFIMALLCSSAVHTVADNHAR